jgi:hypothetical protein
MRLEHIPHAVTRLSALRDEIDAMIEQYGDLPVFNAELERPSLDYDSVRATADGYAVIR